MRSSQRQRTQRQGASCLFPSRQYVTVDWHAAQADTGGCVERIAQRWRSRGRAGLADTARCFPTLDHMDFNVGDFVYPQHAVVVEIALLYTAFGDCDVAVQCGSETEYQTALKLCDNGIGIDGDA